MDRIDLYTATGEFVTTVSLPRVDVIAYGDQLFIAVDGRYTEADSATLNRGETAQIVGSLPIATMRKEGR